MELDDISRHQRFAVRRYIGKCYTIIDELPNFTLNDIDVHKRSVVEDHIRQQYVVPAFVSTFESHAEAQDAYTQLQDVAREKEININDVQYNQDDKQLSIIFEPLLID